VAHLLVPAFARLGQADLSRLLDYDFTGGRDSDRAAACTWIADEGVAATPDQLTVTMGGQHALLAAVAALTKPGEAVFAEALTYPGLRLAAATIDRRVEPLPIDQHGLLPEAVDRALAAHPGAVIYGMTTHHNPTTATMPPERRQAIADSLRRHGGYFIEDGIYAFLADPVPTPLQTLARDRVVYITSLSKSLSPGFRVGYAVSPPSLSGAIAAAARSAATMPPILLARIAADIITDGTAQTVRAAQRAEIRRRLDIARDYLPQDAFTSAVTPHLWMHLPEPWRADAFAAEAMKRGVAISPASAFATARQMPEAVRISISAPRDHAQLQRGLCVIRDLLAVPPPLCGVLV
jgi:DNA-binding transcriptional MocR family regulator